jgi:hypothetical protein
MFIAAEIQGWVIFSCREVIMTGLKCKAEFDQSFQKVLELMFLGY